MRRSLIGLIIVAASVAAWAGWQLAPADPPEAVRDRSIGSIGVNSVSGTFCYEGSRKEEIACVGQEAPRRFKGLVLMPVDGTSCFLPDHEELPRIVKDGDCLDLEDPADRLGPVWEKPEVPSGAWRVIAVDFVGRRSKAPLTTAPVGGSLSMEGVRRHEVEIDQVRSVRELPKQVYPDLSEEGVLRF